MEIKNGMDRRLMLMVLCPLARAILLLLTGYLTAKGIPVETVGQLGEALGVVSVLGFNVGWDVISKKRAEVRGATQTLDALYSRELPPILKGSR